MKNNHNIFQKLVILEMANNHMGDLSHAFKIIKTYKKFQKKFNFKFAFKLQYRHLGTFIHKSFKNRNDLHYIKRFNDTKLSNNQFNKIINFIKKNNFYTIATPFDEKSVDLILKQNLDYIKVASCSFDDWPLLEKISTTEKPLVLSTAGASLNTIDNVVSFLKNRDKNFCLMHCVGQYPTPKAKLNLARIKLLKNRYEDVPIGYSTHEDPNDFVSIKVAISQGASTFEKHVGLPTKDYDINKYSLSPDQCNRWLSSMSDTFRSLSSSNINIIEKQSLNSLRRGIFLKKKYEKNKNINKKDLYFAFPCINGQLTANDLSKYTFLISKKNIQKDTALMVKDIKIVNSRNLIFKYLTRIKKLILKSNIIYPKNSKLEISHHYGIENFLRYGLSMITIVNRKYCKKILILLPGQTHPTQYHKIKEETFNIVYGKMILYLDNKKQICKPGDIVTIKNNVKHKFSTENGCIIEEISTTHNISDSFYEDKIINNNKNRKTVLNYW